MKCENTFRHMLCWYMKKKFSMHIHKIMIITCEKPSVFLVFQNYVEAPFPKKCNKIREMCKNKKNMFV